MHQVFIKTLLFEIITAICFCLLCIFLYQWRSNEDFSQDVCAYLTGTVFQHFKIFLFLGMILDTYPE